MQRPKHAGDGIGLRLRRLLEVRGETIKSLSDRTGIPYRTLHNHVGGSAKPNAEQLALLVRAGIDANYLLTGRLTAETSLIAFALSSDEASSTVFDRELLEAIERRAIGIVDELLQSSPGSPETEITFDKVFDLYVLTARRLAALLKGTEVLIADAKRKGLSIDKFMGTVLDTATGVYVRELADTFAAP